MTTTDTEEVQYADYYQCSAGLTVGLTVCEEGEVVPGSEMGFTKSNPPLSEEDQVKAYGQVMYKEYDPEDDEEAVLQQQASSVRALQGMNTPDMPPVDPAPGAAEVPLETLSRQQLRQRAKKLGLNFPEDTDREQLLGAIQKKQQETAGARTEEESEIIKKRRESAKEAIEANNELISGGGSSGGGSATRTPRRAPARQEVPEEEERPNA